LKELYPDKVFDTIDILNLIDENIQGRLVFIFSAERFAEKAGLEPLEFGGKLFRSLGVELEKNWHDKTIFEMSMNSGSITIKVKNGDFDV
jgi:hypothetical protein